jgi:hypothetical protein
MMRFLIVNTDYPGFLDMLYAAHPGLGDDSYARQMAVRNASRFGLSDYYPRNLTDLGHTANEVHINNPTLQRAWAREHELKVTAESSSRIVLRRGIVPWMVRDNAAWMARILSAQIEEFHPDVILSHSLSDLPPTFWNTMRSHYRLLVGQIASPLAADIDLSSFGLMLSSLPNFVDRFRAAGLRAELFRLGFDPVVLSELPDTEPTIDVSFVGSLSHHHCGRLRWLEELCRCVPLQVWGPGIDELPTKSPLHAAYRGTAWGIDMFRVLKRSRISVNYHIEVSGAYANNMRLYETTGVGALLLTDWKQNLGELFEPGVETVVHHSPEECADKVRYYLDRETERARVARAGQERTLREHTYRHRMIELVRLIENVL